MQPVIASQPPRPPPKEIALPPLGGMASQPPTPPPSAREEYGKQPFKLQTAAAFISASMPSPASSRKSPTTPRTSPPGSSRSSMSVINFPAGGDPLLDHSHLKPGHKASLLSYNQTINMYRSNAKKTNSPDVQCDFAIFMVEAAKPLGPEDDETKWEYLAEAEKLLKQLASRGHAESQYYLGNLYASGLLSRKGRNEFDKAFPLFVQATKHHHADAAYRYVFDLLIILPCLPFFFLWNNCVRQLELQNATKMPSVVAETKSRRSSSTGQNHIISLFKICSDAAPTLTLIPIIEKPRRWPTQLLCFA